MASPTWMRRAMSIIWITSFAVHDGLEVVEGGVVSVGVEHLQFFVAGRVSDGEAHHEPVELGLRGGG